MRNLPRKFLLLAAAVVLSTPLSAQQLNLKHSICFGDSLTHNDILGLVNFLPQDMYGMDPFEAMWEKGKPNNATLNRYAIAGSRSQHLWAQITTYELAELFGLAPSGTCFNVEIGGNDFFSNDFILGANPPGTNAKADAVVDDLLDRIHNTVTYLGLRRLNAEIILWTVPDITLTPSRCSKKRTFAPICSALTGGSCSTTITRGWRCWTFTRYTTWSWPNRRY